MIVKSGQNGSFEVPGLARSLPGQLSVLSQLGLSGLDNLGLLLALNQANSLTAGSNSEAATNANNFFAKVRSADTINNLKNYRFKDSKGNNLTYDKYLVAQQEKGVNAPTAFLNAIDGIVQADPEYKRLQSSLKENKGTPRQADIESAIKLRVATLVAGVVPDMQANAGVSTAILQRRFINEQIEGTQNASGAGDAAFSVMSSSNQYKSQQAANELFFARNDAAEPLSDKLGKFSTVLTEYMQKYPELTKYMTSAGIAVASMTAGATVAAGVLMGYKMLGGGKEVIGERLSQGGFLARTGSITVPLMYVTAGAITLSSINDKVRDNWSKKDLKGKVDSLAEGTSGYSTPDVLWELIKNRLRGNSGIKGECSEFCVTIKTLQRDHVTQSPIKING